MEPANQFYDDRHGGVTDPSGNSWWFATHIEDISDEEIGRKMKERDNSCESAASINFCPQLLVDVVAFSQIGMKGAFMHSILRSSLLFLSLFCLPELTYCQWQAMPGPGDGTVNAFAFLGTRAFAATYTGIYASTDTGADWNPVSGVPSIAIIRYIATVNDEVVAAYDSILYRSSDSGITWQTVIPSGIPSGTILTTLFSTGTSLLMVSSTFTSTTYYRSTDAGTTWEKLDSASIPPNWSGSVLRIGTRLFASGASFSGTLIYESTDDGGSWHSAQNALPEYGSAAADGDTIILAGTFMHRSTDGGKTWTQGTDLGTVFGVAAANGAFYAVVDFAGIYRSMDGGITWTMFDNGLPDLIEDVIASCSASVFVLDARSNVYRLPPGGTRWMYSNSGFPRQVVYSLDTSTNGGLFAASLFRAYLSWDEGWGWQPFRESRGFITVLRDTIHMPGEDYIVSEPSGTVFAQLLQVPEDSLIFDTTSNWDPGFTNIDFGGVRGFCIVDSQLVTLVFGLPEIGSVARNSGLPPDSEVDAVGSNGTYLFAATRFHGMYRSSDTGRTWLQSSTGFPDSAFASDTALPPHYFNGPFGAIASDDTTIYVGTPMGVYRSTDSGATWANASVGLPAGRVWSIASYPFGVFAGIEGNGIYFSFDRGDHWSSHTWNIPSGANFYAFQPFDGYLYAAGDSGMFRCPIPFAAGVTQATPSDGSLSLGAIYPNPAHGSGEVIFTTSQAGAVEIDLYDLLGRKEMTLVNSFYPSGTHYASFDATSRADGNYFIVLRAGGQSISRSIHIEP